MARGTRPRGKHIDVWVTDEELAEIDRNAIAVRQSRSEFLRNLGTGYEPKSAFDREAIEQLAKLHAEQGQLRGVLKEWLAAMSGQAAVGSTVREVLEQVEKLQVKIAKLVMEEARRL